MLRHLKAYLLSFSSSCIGSCKIRDRKHVGFKSEKSVLLSWWFPLERFKKYCPAEVNMSLGMGLRVLHQHTISSFHSLLHASACWYELRTSCFSWHMTFFTLPLSSWSHIPLETYIKLNCFISCFWYSILQQKIRHWYTSIKLYT